MPTNVSRPIWRCDLCRARFDDDYEAASRCESAGLPAAMPDGALLLSYRDRASFGGRAAFVLEPLFHVPGWVGTVASRWGSRSGHTVRYWVGIDPAEHTDDDGRLRTPHPEPRRVESTSLWPHTPGAVNQVVDTWIGERSPTGSEPADWVLEAVGLGCASAPVGAEPDSSFVRPMTPAVAAVLDALSARVDPATADRDGTYRWIWGRPLGALAVEACGGPEGCTSLERARWWLRSVPADPLTQAINDRWAAWRAGADVAAPTPRLRCRLRTSASKLTRELRALVAATGVVWPARTSSDDYVRLLINEALEYDMDTTDQLFRAPSVIAVGGTKGGVGKSTTSAALVVRLAADGKRVVLVDCDLTGPSQHLIFGLGPALCDAGTRRLTPSPTTVAGLSVFSPGQLFGPSARTRWSPATTAEWLSFAGSCLDVDDADVVLLDLPPGRGPVHEILFDRHRVPLTAAIHVTTAHPLALADTERGLALNHHGAGHPQILVENLSRAQGLSATGERVEVRLTGSSDASEQLAARLGLRWGGSLPWAPEVNELADTDELRALAVAALAAPAMADQ